MRCELRRVLLRVRWIKELERSFKGVIFLLVGGIRRVFLVNSDVLDYADKIELVFRFSGD